MKKINLLLISLVVILVILALIIILIKINPYRCCSCPASDYHFYPLTKTLYENSRIVVCECSPYAGCVPSFWIIPSDLIGLIVLLLIFLVVKNKLF